MRPCFCGTWMAVSTAVRRHLQDAKRELVRRRPRYVKGMPAQRLEERICEEAVIRAASVEPELSGFLVDIGFIRLNRNSA
jgi:hypothetical protein